MTPTPWTKLILNGGFFLLMFLLLPILAFAQSPPAATYYVATTGSDSNNGTSSTTPFLTIQHALNLCTGGQTVAVASGTYTVLSGSLVTDTTKTRTSMVTILGWGATQPLLQAASGTYDLLSLSGNDLTFENFAMRSENNASIVVIKQATNIVIEDCDLSDPDTADPGQTDEAFVINIGYIASNITVQDCYIHDSEAGITGPGTGPTNESTNISLLNNTIINMTGDGIAFGTWNNVTIDGNVIDNVTDASQSLFVVHNDGIQLYGNIEGAVISNNIVSNIGYGQGMQIASDIGPTDNVLVENNLVYNIGTLSGDNGPGIQTAVTRGVYLNNTLGNAPINLRLPAYNGVVVTDTVVANNEGGGVVSFNGCTTAYEDYNYWTGYTTGTGTHDIKGTTPDFVNTGANDYHPASGSPLFAHGVASFSATVDGTLTNFTAPTYDLDYIRQASPPTMGAYATTAGNYTIAYSGFDYSTTGNAASLTDGASDFGWNATTWTSGTIVSPGLYYDTLPVLGYALSYKTNTASDRPLNPAVMPTGYTTVGSDGVTRLGAAGKTIWLSFLIEPTGIQTGSLTTEVDLNGQSSGGGVKLEIGNVNGAIPSWGMGNGYVNQFVYATHAPSVQTGVPAFLVAEITFGTSTTTGTINLWVDPPLNDTPPTTPDATMSFNCAPFGVIEFKGNLTSIGDEFAIGTTWESVIAGGSPQP